MELIEGKALSKLLLERYSKNPRNWSFTVSPSAKDGFFDAVMANKDEAWQLKLDSIFKPAPFMLGAKADVDPIKIQSPSPIPYGYRKLEPQVLIEILKSFSEEKKAETLRLDSILGSLDTVAPSGFGNYAEGPFVMTNKDATIISEEQRKLDDKLHMEMRKLLRSRYSSYG